MGKRERKDGKRKEEGEIKRGKRENKRGKQKGGKAGEFFSEFLFLARSLCVVVYSVFMAVRTVCGRRRDVSAALCARESHPRADDRSAHKCN